MNYELFGKRLKEERQRQFLSQTNLAKLADMRQPNIRNYERGNVLPNLDSAIRLAKALGVTLDSLVTEARK